MKNKKVYLLELSQFTNPEKEKCRIRFPVNIILDDEFQDPECDNFLSSKLSILNICINNMNIIFIFLAIIHVLIWAFVLLAFIDKRTARINLLYVIPFIYIYYIFFRLILQASCQI